VISSSPHSDQQRRLLERFIQQVNQQPDTPSLIITIAASAEYIQLCRSILHPETAAHLKISKRFNQVCMIHGLHPVRLREMLIPAANTLGIVFPRATPTDFYRRLGVRSQANVEEIRYGFRKKATEVHPDTNAALAGNGEEFVELIEAYHTLRHPASRHCYDMSRHQSMRWWEHTDTTHRRKRRSILVWWYLGAVLLIFIIMLFLVDRFGFRIAAFDSPESKYASEYFSPVSPHIHNDYQKHV
jgi:hypothetical protein